LTIHYWSRSGFDHRTDLRIIMTFRARSFEQLMVRTPPFSPLTLVAFSLGLPSRQSEIRRSHAKRTRSIRTNT